MLFPPACRTSESITKADLTLLVKYCYMNKAMNRLITNFVTNSIIYISKRNIARSKKDSPWCEHWRKLKNDT